MAFCTKCGKALAEGEICDCQKQTEQPNPQNQTFDPYQQLDSNQVKNESNESSQSQKTVVNEEENITINIDKEKVKQNISDTANKLQSGVVKGVGMINDRKQAIENTSVYETNMKIIPDCVSANDGEIPIKQYNFAQLRTRLLFEKSYGRLQITNKRVIFRAAGRSLFGKNILQQEFRIDQIAGVEVRCKKEFNIFNFIIGLIITALFAGLSYLISYNVDNDSSAPVIFLSLIVLAVCGGLTFIHKKQIMPDAMFSLRQLLLSFAAGGYITLIDYSSNGFVYFCAGFMVFACLINLLFMSITENLVAIFKTGASAAIEIKREPAIGLLQFLFSQKDDQNSGFAEILPWKDTYIAIKEVGTIIDDIKTMGDAAIGKWKQA